jgi:hypothetical protein
MEDCFITGQPCTLFRRRCLAEVAPLDPAIVASVDYNILLQVARRHSGADVGRVVLWQRQHSGLRGPEAARYTSRQRVERWKAFDQKLLAALLPELDLCEFMEDVPDGRLTPLQTRHAYFQKAVIAGRKDLWEIAIESIRRGVLATSDVPLGRNERQTLSRMLASRYGIDLFLGNTTIQRRLAKAAGERDIGRAVRLSIASMLTYWTGWGLRKGAPSALASFAALVRLTGLRGAAALLVGVLRRRIGASLTAASGQGKGAMQPAYPAEDYSTEVAN